jgi:hypothetical protein
MKSRFVVLIILLCGLTSCSYFTKRGRQEHAYRSYIRKSSVVRAKQQRKFKFRTPEMAIRQDAPAMTTESESPQSMSSAPAAEPAPSPPN